MRGRTNDCQHIRICITNIFHKFYWLGCAWCACVFILASWSWSILWTCMHSVHSKLLWYHNIYWLVIRISLPFSCFNTVSLFHFLFPFSSIKHCKQMTYLWYHLYLLLLNWMCNEIRRQAASTELECIFYLETLPTVYLKNWHYVNILTCFMSKGVVK